MSSSSMLQNKLVNNLTDFLYEVGLEQPGSFLEEMIAQACDPMIGQPNLSLNLEICDLINKKLKTFPRDAAFCLVRYVNRGNPTSAYLALTLLDNCVKNCGYPFHLVISSKEFLNELVRRFPERPTNISSAQHRILELIQLWNSTLCVNSRYKEDFKHINDMYRLLKYKGYTFPDVRADALMALNTEPSGLRTEEQLEEEDRRIQGIKLEELLRKGTPAALAEANDLMKLMAGYDLSKKPDYKKQVNMDIDRIESKVILLNDTLNQLQSQSKNISNALQSEIISELYSTVKSSQSKVTSFIENNDDEDRLARLLELNDLINVVLQKHDDIKNGKPVQHNDLDRVQKSPSPSNQTGSANSKTAPSLKTGPINLIDFDDFSIPAAGSVSQQPSVSNNLGNMAGAGLLDDFSGLDFGSSKPSVDPFQQSQQLFSDNQTQFVQPSFPQQQQFPLSNTSIGLMSAVSGFSTNQMPIQNSQPNSTSSSPSYKASSTNYPSGLNSANILANHHIPPTSKPTQLQQPPTAGFDLMSGGSQDLLEFMNPAPSITNTATSIAATSNSAKEATMFDKNGLQIKLQTQIGVVNGIQQVQAKATFINVTPVPFTDLQFQLAVPKAMNLKMDKITGTTIISLNQSQVHQPFSIANPQNDAPRLRFRLQYKINGAVVNETGEYTIRV